MNNVRRPLDPRKCNVAIDANSLDRINDSRTAAIDRLLTLQNDGIIQLIVPRGVRHEMQNPRTPEHVRNNGLSQIFTLRVEPNPQESFTHQIIEMELQGKANLGKHAADADHLCEAAKYCAYFITNDARILSKAGNLRNVLPPSLQVVTLAEFFEIYDKFADGILI